jgi:hypothetical protein
VLMVPSSLTGAQIEDRKEGRNGGMPSGKYPLYTGKR